MKFKTTQIIVTDDYDEKLGSIEMEEGLEPVFEPNAEVKEFNAADLETILNKMKEFQNEYST